MLELTNLEAVSLTNLLPYPEPMPNPSPYLFEMQSSASSSTIERVPSPALFLESVTTSSILDEFLDSNEIAQGTSKIPLSPCQEASTSNTDAIVEKKPNRWTIPNDERPRRFRARHYCSKCLIDFTDKAKLGQHMISEHQINRPFDCDECGRTFRSSLTLNRHKRLHDAKAPQYSCDRCEYITIQKSNLTSHKRRHDKQYTYKCEVCGAGFMERTKFQEHKLLHSGQAGSHRCKLCRRLFYYRRNLVQHQRECHSETLAEPVEIKIRLPCNQCKKTFVKEQSLQRHLKARHSRPAEVHSCEECNAVLSCKSALVQHLRSHRGEKVAVCEECGKSFTKWQNLRVHQRIHTGQRPYACEFCDRAFAQRTTLVHHTRIHTGERPYKCDRCDKGFVSSTLLKKHALKHEKRA